MATATANARMIDRRSETVTRPTAAMRAAMAAAEVGDDVMGEDPTVRELERRTAALFGKEAALFVPSGTMSNQLAVGVQAGPGDEILIDPSSHIVVWEGGGAARLFGVTAHTVAGDRGLLGVDHLAGAVRPVDMHYTQTRLVCLENTHNRGGGRVHPIEDVVAVSRWARGQGLAMHLDGARVMNAVVASGVPADHWGAHFDTISVCFSKGLGAPVGSALVGGADLIRKALRLRKVLGGGMRQAGVIAAAALYALDHHVDRLADDHRNARTIARAVEETDGLHLESGPVETNLVWIEVDPALGTAAEVAARLKAEGVLMAALGPQVLRACTHLDVSAEQAEYAADRLRTVRSSATAA